MKKGSKTLFSQRSVGLIRKIPYLTIASVWLALYLPNLRTVPGWYGDETMIYWVSQSLLKGVPATYSVWNTFWGPFFPYQPLYVAASGLLSKLIFHDIYGGRFFNSLLALICGVIIYCYGKLVFSKKSAFFGSLVFLTYFQNIVHFRMCYAHNAAGLGVLLLTLALVEKDKKQNLLLASLGLAISASAHPFFIYAACGAVLVLINKPKKILLVLLPSLFVVTSSILVAYIFFGKWVLEDINDLALAYKNTGQNTHYGYEQLISLYSIVTLDWFHVGSCFGLLLLLRKKYYTVPIIVFVCLILLTKNRANLSVFYYQVMIITPSLALGWVSCMESFLNKRKVFFTFVSSALWLVPVASGILNFKRVCEKKLFPNNYYWVTQSCDEVECAAKWLNERTTSEDTVVANENIAWLLKAKTATYIQMITWYGYSTQGLSRKKERFIYDASLESSKYAIIGDIDSRWAFGNDNVYRIAKMMEDQKWTPVWCGQFYTIYQNPNYSFKK